MILALNAILDEQPRLRFDEETLPRLRADSLLEARIAYLVDPAPFPDVDGFSHLLITGSELSASKRHERDEDVYALARGFVEAGKAVLGICWGHQMLAKALVGPHVCRRAARPEFGWRHVSILPNPLFAGIDELVSAHSHFDEIFDLPAGFEVIASTPDCAVQGFQLTGRPVWGVQFHPEVTYVEGRAMVQRNLGRDPSIKAYLHDELGDPGRLAATATIFANFFRSPMQAGG
jgi:GMP synthase (glutamine-hydrolysing)